MGRLVQFISVYLDGRDFILIAKAIKPMAAKSLDQQVLWQYGEGAYRGGRDQLVKLVADARAGLTLNI